MSNCLKAAQNSLCIQVVNLRRGHVIVHDDISVDDISSIETRTQSFRGFERAKEMVLSESDGGEHFVYLFVYSVGIRLIKASDEGVSASDDFEPMVEVVALFEAKYLSKDKLSREEIQAFSENNVGYHVWPYWREYVQSSCARMGLFPAFEIPVYIIPGKDGDE